MLANIVTDTIVEGLKPLGRGLVTYSSEFCKIVQVCCTPTEDARASYLMVIVHGGGEDLEYDGNFKFQESATWSFLDRVSRDMSCITHRPIPTAPTYQV